MLVNLFPRAFRFEKVTFHTDHEVCASIRVMLMASGGDDDGGDGIDVMTIHVHSSNYPIWRDAPSFFV